MSKPKWNKGAPPSVGWWPASFGRNKDSIRWWDGFFWSDFALPSYTAKMAAKCASLKNGGDGIEWTERWWL
jgi:hypothetical protein